MRGASCVYRIALVLAVVVPWSNRGGAAQLRQFGRPGDITIGALLPMYNPVGCSVRGVTASLLYVEPLVSQLRTRNFRLESSSKACSGANNKSTCVPLSFSLGYHFVDMCWSSEQALDGLITMLRASCPAGGGGAGGAGTCAGTSGAQLGGGSIAGIIGPLLNTPTYAAAPMASAYGTPLVGLLASSDRFRCDLSSDGSVKDSTCVQDFEYMFRMVASDIFGIIAIARIVEALPNVSYLGIVTYADDFHRTARRSLLQLLNRDSVVDGIRIDVHPDLCIAFQSEFSSSDAHRNLVTTAATATSCAELCERYRSSPPSESLLRAVDAVQRNAALRFVVLVASDEDSSAFLDARAYGACRCASSSSSSSSPPQTDCEPPREVAVIGAEKWHVFMVERIGSGFYQRCAGLGNVLRVRPDYKPALKRHAGQLFGRARQALRDFIRSPTPEFSASDPFLCEDLARGLEFPGICNASVTCAPRQDGSCLDRDAVASTSAPVVNLAGEPHTFLSSSSYLIALQNVLDEFTRSAEAQAGRRSAADFRRYAYGARLLKALQSARVCNSGDHYDPDVCGNDSFLVFKEGGNEIVAQFSLLAMDHQRRETNFFSFGSLDNVSGPMRRALLNMSWSLTGGTDLLHGECHPFCAPGQFKSLNRYNCCFTCQPCPANTYAPSAGLLMCLPCGYGNQSNAASDGCALLELRELPGSFIYTLVSLISVLTALMLFTLAVMVYFIKTPIIQSSDKYLTFSILAMLLCDTVALVVFVPQPPSEAACRFRVQMSSLLTSISVTLFVKTTRLARISNSMSLVHSRFMRWTFSNAAQVVLVIVLSVIPVTLDLYSAFGNDRSARLTFILEEDEQYSILTCPDESGVQIFVDIYLSLIVLATAYVAFLTRKLPVSFNEARFLFLATLTNAMTCIPLSATYHLVAAGSHLYVESMRAFSFILLTWLWLFTPRLYIVLLRPNRNRVKPAFKTADSTYTQNSNVSEMHAPVVDSRRRSATALLKSPGHGSTASTNGRTFLEVTSNGPRPVAGSKPTSERAEG